MIWKFFLGCAVACVAGYLVKRLAAFDLPGEEGDYIVGLVVSVTLGNLIKSREVRVA